MSAHYKLRRRDARWLMFPALVVLCGLLAIGMVVFSPDLKAAAADEPVPAISATQLRAA